MMQKGRAGFGLRMGAVGALILGTLPICTLPILLAGKRGFIAYLSISDVYYRGASSVLGPNLFPRHEYGVVPRGAAGIVTAGILYGALGAAIGFLVGAICKRR